MKIQYLLYMAAALSFTSCNDAFLDRSPQSLNDETFWKSVSDLKTFANAFYNTLPGGVTNLGDEDSDNQIPFMPNSFLWGQYTVPTEGSDDGRWTKASWQNIRQLNYFMTHYKRVNASEEEMNPYVAEIRFFRALEYFEKIQIFGDVPWLESELTIDSEELYGNKMPRNEVAKKIVQDLEFAVEWLPEKGKEENNRLNKDIARHVMARVCLNEGTYYKYHKELGYDADVVGLLQKAADATDALIASSHYEIYKTGHPEVDYYNLFVMEDKSSLKEAILYIDYATALREHNASHWLRNAKSGWSKDFADCFLYTDGKPASVTSKAHERNKTMAEEAQDRDPRFKQLILTGDAPYTMTVDGGMTFITKDEDFVRADCPSGYWVRKYFTPDPSQDIEAKGTIDGIAYRYAETLLVNAEAKAELKTITQEDLDKTINQLRKRVGMPDLKLDIGFVDTNWPNWGYDLSPLLQEIRRERRVELAGEGFRFADLKRWKAGKLLENSQTYMGKYVKGEDGQFHQTVIYENYASPEKARKWDDKMYLYPIPTGELQRNPNLLPQNPGW